MLIPAGDQGIITITFAALIIFFFLLGRSFPSYGWSIS
jgi:hypothetical protein